MNTKVVSFKEELTVKPSTIEVLHRRYPNMPKGLNQLFLGLTMVSLLLTGCSEDGAPSNNNNPIVPDTKYTDPVNQVTPGNVEVSPVNNNQKPETLVPVFSAKLIRDVSGNADPLSLQSSRSDIKGLQSGIALHEKALDEALAQLKNIQDKGSDAYKTYSRQRNENMQYLLGAYRSILEAYCTDTQPPGVADYIIIRKIETALLSYLHEHGVDEWIQEYDMQCKSKDIEEYVKNYVLTNYTGNLLTTRFYTSQKEKDAKNEFFQLAKDFLIDKKNAGAKDYYVTLTHVVNLLEAWRGDQAVFGDDDIKWKHQITSDIQSIYPHFQPNNAVEMNKFYDELKDYAFSIILGANMENVYSNFSLDYSFTSVKQQQESGLTTPGDAAVNIWLRLKQNGFKPHLYMLSSNTLDATNIKIVDGNAKIEGMSGFILICSDKTGTYYYSNKQEYYKTSEKVTTAEYDENKATYGSVKETDFVAKLGQQDGSGVWKALKELGYLNNQGEITNKYKFDAAGFNTIFSTDLSKYNYGDKDKIKQINLVLRNAVFVNALAQEGFDINLKGYELLPSGDQEVYMSVPAK
ncbi:MAG TPA: hypothetical protein DF296_05880 [Candidatus Margulisbacteria bacterium]|nr:hypothetical protein [Candidatus Margulisiibacteriota bacterium]